MTWAHLPNSACSVEEGAASWGLDCSAGEPSATSKRTSTPSESSELESPTDSSTTRPSGTTLARSTGHPGLDSWMSSLRASRASHSVPPGSGAIPVMNPETCGPIPYASFAKYDPESCSLRTSQVCLLPAMGTTAKYSEAWPRAGIMRFGTVYQLPPLVPRTSGIVSGCSLPTPAALDYGSSQNGINARRPSANRPSLETMARHGLWPTPLASDGQGGVRKPDGRRGADLRSAIVRPDLWPTPTAGDAKSSGNRNLPGSKANPGVSLTDAVLTGNSKTPRRWPTPAATDHKIVSKPGQRRGQLGEAVRFATPTTRDGRNNGNSSRYQEDRRGLELNAQVGGKLNPRWVEWLMGWPIGWTLLDPLDPDAMTDWDHNKEWWSLEPVERTTPGLVDRVGQLRVIGNGQVPQVMREVWRVLVARAWE